MSQPTPRRRCLVSAFALLLSVGTAIAPAQQPDPATGSATDPAAESATPPSGTPEGSSTETGQGGQGEQGGEPPANATDNRRQPANDHNEDDAATESNARAALDSLKRQLSLPAPDAAPASVREQLDRLIDRAADLVDTAGPAAVQLQARSLQMQALYLRVQRWPDRPDAADRLAELRVLARRTKALDHPHAEPLADFWLLVSEMLDINRTGLAPAERRRQLRPLLRDYLRDHPEADPTPAVRRILDRLIPDPDSPNSDPAAQPEGPAAPAEPETGSTTPPDSPARPSEPTNDASPPAAAPDDDAPDAPDSATDPPGSEPTSDAASESTAGGKPAFTLGETRTTEAGVIEIPLHSPFQPAANPLRILLPDELPPPGSRRFLFVLPVEAHPSEKWGDGLQAVREADLHNRHDLIVVAPAFRQTPWYADHPDNPAMRQESYLLRSVLPAVDKLYPSEGGRPARLLLGFSKSGWGALSLLLRHPDRFHAAAAWDAPLMQRAPDAFGMHKLFPTKARFDRYALPDQLREHASRLKRHKRIALLGYDNFRDHMQRAHRLLTRLRIPHRYADGPQRDHHWNTGWVPEAVRALVDMAPR